MGVQFERLPFEKPREKARLCRQQVLASIDPLVAREKAERDKRLAAAKEVTFLECAEGWMKRNATTWTPDRLAQIKRRLEMYAYPKLEGGKLPIQKLDVRTENSAAADLLFNVLKPLWRPKEEGGQLPTAIQLRMDIECILDWAWAADYIRGDAAAMKAKLDLRLPNPSFHEVVHHPFVDFKNIGQFMAKLRASVDKTGTVQAGQRSCLVCSHPQREEFETVLLSTTWPNGLASPAPASGVTASRHISTISRTSIVRSGVHWPPTRLNF
jgi:Phage integrase central domain